MTSVLIGDIINSQEGGQPSGWLAHLKQVLNQYGQEPESWEIYRGDSFQLETPKPENALLAAIHIKAFMISKAQLNVRLAIGIGTKNHDAAKVTESNGEAFVRAGELFENLKKNTLAIHSPWSTIDEQLNLYLELALLTIDQWTNNSAEIACLTIENPEATQKQLASMLGITQGRVSERLKRAGVDEILKLDARYRQLILEKLQDS